MTSPNEGWRTNGRWTPARCVKWAGRERLGTRLGSGYEIACIACMHFFALAPIFARLKNKKCLERAGNLTETLATQARYEILRLSILPVLYAPVASLLPEKRSLKVSQVQVYRYCTKRKHTDKQITER